MPKSRKDSAKNLAALKARVVTSNDSKSGLVGTGSHVRNRMFSMVDRTQANSRYFNGIVNRFAAG